MTRAEAWLDDHRPDQIHLLQALVRVPSAHPDDDLPAAAEAFARELEGLGFAIERHCAGGAVVNLVARARFGDAGDDAPVVVLQAHGDTVPVGIGWSRPPLGGEIDGGWLYGRGAALSKSDVAVYAFAIRALEAAGVPLVGSVELHVTWDEEAGSDRGAGWLLDQGLTRPTHAIAAGLSYGVATAHNGCLQLEVEIEGRAAHAALPGIGIDALEAAHRLMAGLYAIRSAYPGRLSAVPGLGSPQLTINMIEGGSHPNVLPDQARLRLDRRLIPEEDLDGVAAELDACIAQAVSRLHAVEWRSRTILRAEPMAETPANRALAERVARHASAVLGEPVLPMGLPLFSEGRHYAARGVPTVLYGAGPRSLDEANVHRADERVPLAELHGATLVVLRVLTELLAPARA